MTITGAAEAGAATVLLGAVTALAAALLAEGGFVVEGGGFGFAFDEEGNATIVGSLGAADIVVEAAAAVGVVVAAGFAWQAARLTSTATRPRIASLRRGRGIPLR